MKILYDYQTFSIQNYGGISRYFFELMSHLSIMPDVDVELGISFSNNKYLEGSKKFAVPRFFPNINFRGKSRFLRYINSRKSMTAVRKGNYDIFHPTYYEDYLSIIPKGKKTVITVHDLAHEIFNDIREKDQPAKNKELAIKNADQIIAISENTKKDLIKYYDLPKDKINVIHHASSNFPTLNQNIKLAVPDNYLLYVGDRHYYKNFTWMINSLSEIISKKIYLVCAGGKKPNNTEVNLLRSLNISDKVLFLPDINDEILGFLYSNAKAFIFPSTYEGFGIPILESFSCDCPVVCSDTSSLPEVAGNAALYFDPNDDESIRNAVERVLSDDELRRGLIKKGRERNK
jgi:glycosyltransferase involved in cell wall biosynthesis